MGDQIRLGDADLWIQVERDLTFGGEEALFGGDKSIREPMAQSTVPRSAGAPDTVITNTGNNLVVRSSSGNAARRQPQIARRGITRLPDQPVGLIDRSTLRPQPIHVFREHRIDPVQPTGSASTVAGMSGVCSNNALHPALDHREQCRPRLALIRGRRIGVHRLDHRAPRNLNRAAIRAFCTPSAASILISAKSSKVLTLQSLSITFHRRKCSPSSAAASWSAEWNYCIATRAGCGHSCLFARDLSVGTDWDQVRGLLRSALDAEGYDVVLGNATDDVVRAAALLHGTYTLVVTNVPYLSRQKMDADLYDFVVENHGLYSGDLAATMVDRCRKFAGRTGTVAVVIPDKLLIAPTYRTMRQDLLRSDRWVSTAILGPRAFSTTMFDFGVALLSMDPVRPSLDSTFPLIDASGAPSFETQQLEILRALADRTSTRSQLDRPDSRIGVSDNQTGATLAEYADAYYGLGSGDYGHYGRKFWELPALGSRWVFQQSTVSAHEPYGGREHILLWEDGRGALSREPGAFLRNTDVWGSRGVMVSLTGSLWCSIYHGDAWDSNAAPIIPKNPDLLPALWAFCVSGEFSAAVRSIDRSVKVMNKTLLKIPFDAERWTSIAKRRYPYGLPEPTSMDVTQWLFNGHLHESTHPLQVAVARLLGYRWPDQSQDSLDGREDLDGIASLQSLPGEPDLATRLRELLSTVYGREWSSALERKLVTHGGGKTGKLEDWLRDTFFIQHVKVFANRPFLWHIWDGRKDGFSAIVNYHKLDRRTLEKLTFTSLGTWIERQKHETRAERAGADTRLAAAEDLQRRLKLILEGAPPHDVYVRWKPMAEQPIGWEPDLDDGVRLNIRPFVTAGVLRSKINVHWKKDRGTNPDGSARHNDLHPTLDERRAARRAAEATE